MDKAICSGKFRQAALAKFASHSMILTMKNLILSALAAAGLFAFVGCASSDDNAMPSSASTTTTSEDSTTSAVPLSPVAPAGTTASSPSP